VLPLCDACGTSIDGAAARRVWWNTVFYDADPCPKHSSALVELMDAAIAAGATRRDANPSRCSPAT